MADPADYLLALLDVPSRLGADADVTLFCVIDTASDPLTYPALRQFAAEERIVPLYQGETAARLAAVAPYLVEPIADGELLAWLFEEMAETSWGILVWNTATLDALRAHFRSLSRVRIEDGMVMLFRLYDPRVLAAFLSSCDAPQLNTVFGPVTVFGVPVIGTNDIRMFTRSTVACRRWKSAWNLSLECQKLCKTAALAVSWFRPFFPAIGVEDPTPSAFGVPIHAFE